MLKLLSSLCIFSYLLSPVGCPPPLPVVQLAENAVEHSHSMIADLNLFSPPSHSSEWPTAPLQVPSPMTHLPLVTSQQPLEAHLPSAAAVSDARSVPTVQQGVILPDQSLSGSSSRSRLTPLVPVEQARLLQNDIIFPITPGLDPSLEVTLGLNGASEKFVALPIRIQNVPSLWFESFFADAIQGFGSPRMRVEYRRKRTRTDMTDDMMQDVLEQGTRMLFLKTLYVIKIPQAFSPSVGPGEVLVRFHSRLTLGQQPQIRSKLSAWSTTGQGRALAFLGLFHCPAKFFTKLIDECQGREFSADRLVDYPLLAQPQS